MLFTPHSTASWKKLSSVEFSIQYDAEVCKGHHMTFDDACEPSSVPVQSDACCGGSIRLASLSML